MGHRYARVALEEVLPERSRRGQPPDRRPQWQGLHGRRDRRGGRPPERGPGCRWCSHLANAPRRGDEPDTASRLTHWSPTAAGSAPTGWRSASPACSGRPERRSRRRSRSPPADKPRLPRGPSRTAGSATPSSVSRSGSLSEVVLSLPLWRPVDEEARLGLLGPETSNVGRTWTSSWSAPEVHHHPSATVPLTSCLGMTPRCRGQLTFPRCRRLPSLRRSGIRRTRGIALAYWDQRCRASGQYRPLPQSWWR